jgi:hypothetical protein
MIVAALTWPEALVGSVSVVMLGIVISVAIWQVFRTGQTAIRKEARQHEDLEGLRKEVEQLRVDVGRPVGAD